ncbi:hypothetical protein K493DRAFT_406482 [Basidiobolus meristosporus CBS 931.73]|uniref:C2H2-type domain-containing protein n=1 Tax=Basidiobolus meristosporus CBS 931.73 TaxID=1314790 RepID=A0A1Y1YL65_9FUNG|nr:hypothetical protein K493DRAFT_406482 [Basidiobolus meristosporus CBS 931.73]|eukprot:ORX98738.1 hypothetical protein K493DRAFT_406482 [Basidiobolus meristosporus CBS 931.73]
MTISSEFHPQPSFLFSKNDKFKVNLKAARENLQNKSELRLQNNSTNFRTIHTCSVCGKKYKHKNCLYKHFWEHHESWETCLKFNLTKHQQVQMMEAAQILVDMVALPTPQQPRRFSADAEAEAFVSCEVPNVQRRQSVPAKWLSM